MGPTGDLHGCDPEGTGVAVQASSREASWEQQRCSAGEGVPGPRPSRPLRWRGPGPRATRRRGRRSPPRPPSRGPRRRWSSRACRAAHGRGRGGARRAGSARARAARRPSGPRRGPAAPRRRSGQKTPRHGHRAAASRRRCCRDAGGLAANLLEGTGPDLADDGGQHRPGQFGRSSFHARPSRVWAGRGDGECPRTARSPRGQRTRWARARECGNGSERGTGEARRGVSGGRRSRMGFWRGCSKNRVRVRRRLAAPYLTDRRWRFPAGLTLGAPPIPESLQNPGRFKMSSVACCSTDGGIVRFWAWAGLRLMKSNFWRRYARRSGKLAFHNGGCPRKAEAALPISRRLRGTNSTGRSGSCCPRWTPWRESTRARRSYPSGRRSRSHGSSR